MCCPFQTISDTSLLTLVCLIRRTIIHRIIKLSYPWPVFCPLCSLSVCIAAASARYQQSKRQEDRSTSSVTGRFFGLGPFYKCTPLTTDLHMKNYFTMILKSLINKPKDKSQPCDKLASKSCNRKKEKVILNKVRPLHGGQRIDTGIQKLSPRILDVAAVIQNGFCFIFGAYWIIDSIRRSLKLNCWLVYW